MHGAKPTTVPPLEDELNAEANQTASSHSGVSETHANELGWAASNLLRTKWFAMLGQDAKGSITVPFDELFEHIEDSFDLELLHTEELRLAAASRIAENLEDVILAIACSRGDRTAWFLAERDLTPLLARMCELRVNETDAMLHASRFMRRVQARTREEELLEVLSAEVEQDFFPHDGTPCLQDYTGLHPLRSFLGGPLFAILQDLIRDGLIEATQPGIERDRSTRCLRLAD